MIYDKIENLDRYRGLGRDLDKVIDDIKNNLEGEMKDSRIGKNIFDFNCLESGDKRLENHLKFYDFHLVLEGKEDFELCKSEDLLNPSPKNYEEDVYFGDCEKDLVRGSLKSGYFLITFIDEAHKLGISSPAGNYVKKIVYKLPVGGQNEKNS